MVEGGAFQIVAIPCYPWLVGTPPTADAPVGVPTNRRQFEMHPKEEILKFCFIKSVILALAKIDIGWGIRTGT